MLVPRLTQNIFSLKTTPSSPKPSLRIRVVLLSALGIAVLVIGAVLLLGAWRGIAGLTLAVTGAIMCFIGSHIASAGIATLLSLRKKGMFHEEEGE